MKYIKNLFNFKKSKISLPSERLYEFITEEDYFSFGIDHEVINCDNLLIDVIKKFMKSESIRNIKYQIRLSISWLSKDDDEYTQRVILDLYNLKNDVNNSKNDVNNSKNDVNNSNLTYWIDKFDDDWFLVKVLYRMHDFVYLKCDTIDGVYQSILDYNKFIK